MVPPEPEPVTVAVPGSAADVARREEVTGYQAIQRTRPQTLAYGLADSPVGLAAWIVEKFRSWTDCGGEVETALTELWPKVGDGLSGQAAAV